MNRISRCDWLPERARWSYLARSAGIRALSRKETLSWFGVLSHIINPLLAKRVRSRWLDIGLVLFLRSSLSINTQNKILANIQPSCPHAWSITHISYSRYWTGIRLQYYRRINLHCSANHSVSLIFSKPIWSLLQVLLLSNMQMNIWKMVYLNWGERYEFMIDYRSYAHNLTSCEIKAWKKSRPERDSNPWPLRHRYSALPTELSSQLGS